MFRLPRIVSLLLLFLLAPVSRSHGQDFYRETSSAKDRGLGFGLQISHPVAGLSVRWNIDERLTAQGVVGLLGIGPYHLRSMGIRGIYRFEQIRMAEPYLFIAANMLETWTTGSAKDRFPGYGAGGGIEYAREPDSDVIWNAEIGFGEMLYKGSAIHYSNIMYGIGVHYYFQR